MRSIALAMVMSLAFWGGSADASTVTKTLYFHGMGGIFFPTGCNCTEKFWVGNRIGDFSYDDQLGTREARPLIHLSDNAYVDYWVGYDVQASTVLFNSITKTIFGTSPEDTLGPVIYFSENLGKNYYDAYVYLFPFKNGGLWGQVLYGGEVSLSPIPLPPALGLFATSLACLGFRSVSRRFRSKTAVTEAV